jgi:hypothetical protein
MNITLIFVTIYLHYDKFNLTIRHLPKIFGPFYSIFESKHPLLTISTVLVLESVFVSIPSSLNFVVPTCRSSFICPGAVGIYIYYELGA